MIETCKLRKKPAPINVMDGWFTWIDQFDVKKNKIKWSYFDSSWELIKKPLSKKLQEFFPDVPALQSIYTLNHPKFWEIYVYNSEIQEK